MNHSMCPWRTQQYPHHQKTTMMKWRQTLPPCFPAERLLIRLVATTRWVAHRLAAVTTVDFATDPKIASVLKQLTNHKSVILRNRRSYRPSGILCPERFRISNIRPHPAIWKRLRGRQGPHQGRALVTCAVLILRKHDNVKSWRDRHSFLQSNRLPADHQ